MSPNSLPLVTNQHNWLEHGAKEAKVKSSIPSWAETRCFQPRATGCGLHHSWPPPESIVLVLSAVEKVSQTQGNPLRTTGSAQNTRCADSVTIHMNKD